MSARARAHEPKEIRINLLLLFDSDFENRGITGGTSGSVLISSIGDIRSSHRIGDMGGYVLVSFRVKTRLASITCNPGHRASLATENWPQCWRGRARCRGPRERECQSSPLLNPFSVNFGIVSHVRITVNLSKAGTTIGEETLWS